LKQVLNSRDLIKIFAQAIVIILIVWLAAVLAITKLANEPLAHLSIMTVAALICLAGTIAGLVPLVFLAIKNASWMGRAFLLSVPLRLLSTLILGLLGCMFISNQQRNALLLWLTGYYLLMLAWETALAVKFVNKYADFGTIKSNRRNASMSMEDDIKP
jgi:hypothetical protein